MVFSQLRKASGQETRWQTAREDDLEKTTKTHKEVRGREKLCAPLSRTGSMAISWRYLPEGAMSIITDTLLASKCLRQITAVLTNPTYSGQELHADGCALER